MGNKEIKNDTRDIRGRYEPERKIMNLNEYNSEAWKKEVEHSEVHTIPVSREDFQKARDGFIQIPFTPTKCVPLDWIGNIEGKRVLCLAASGGQQAPLFALMGAQVTVLDLCKEPLEFGHSLEDQIGGEDPLDAYISTFIATRASK